MNQTTSPSEGGSAAGSFTPGSGGGASGIVHSVNHGCATRLPPPYPKVLPKYRNPKNPTETWAGRGKQPRWLTAEMRRGKKLADFLIIRR